MIRILVADDHPLWRRGVCDLLDGEPDLSVVGQAGDGAEALDLIRTVPADVALLDMEMPRMSGVEVTRTVRAEGLTMRLLALSAYDEPEYVSGLMDAGADGYITKERPPEMLLEAVRAVADGQGRWFVRAVPASDHTSHLSEREREVLTLVGQGLTNDEIGRALFLSPLTAKTHVSRIMSKLLARDRVQLVVVAYETGLVTPGRTE